MNIIGIVGTALIAAIFAVTLKRYNQEYAVTFFSRSILLIANISKKFAVFAKIRKMLIKKPPVPKQSGGRTGYLLPILATPFLDQLE